MFTRVEKGVLVKFARWTGFGFGSSLDQRAESKHEAEEAVGRRWIYTSSPLAVAFLVRLSTSFYIPFTYPRLLVYQNGRINTVGHGTTAHLHIQRTEGRLPCTRARSQGVGARMGSGSVSLPVPEL